MSRHNYTNPAFCQQNEFYEERGDGTVDIISTTPSKMQRSESTRSFHKPTTVQGTRNVFQRVHSERHPKQLKFPQRELPPKPGPKPRIVEGGPTVGNNVPRYGSITSISTSQSTIGKYALVPVEELTPRNTGRYAVVPESEIEMITAARIVKSQDHLDRIMSSPVDDDLDRHNLSADQFTSLPPMVNASSSASITTPGRLVSAFSTDFGSKSFVLYDQKSMQRYEVVPTEENEELVDPNHEIIQMQNGRPHRYAMIPTDDQEETCLNPPYATIKSAAATPPKRPMPTNTHRSPVRYIPPPNSGNLTPRKNPIATQKLHELLCTPQKQVRQQSTTPRSTPVRVRPPQQPPLLGNSTPTKLEFTPQKLEYEQIRRTASELHLEARTTAVISPRLQSQSIYSETTTTTNNSLHKSWNSIQATKAAGPATVGAISLMLVLCGILNAGLSMYLTSTVSTFRIDTEKIFCTIFLSLSLEWSLILS